MKLSVVLPAAYCGIALLAWLDFMRLPPDGLANVGLMLIVWPVTLLDFALRPEDAPGRFVLMPDRFGYYADHTIFYAASVALLAAGLYALGRWLDRARAEPGKGS